MSETIDVLTAIDVPSVLNSLTNDKNNPGGVGNQNVFMIVTAGNKISGQATGELKISAKVGDNVRWRETSLSSNFEYSVMFYNFVDSDTEDVLLTQPQLVGGLSEASHTAIVANEMQPIQGDMPWSGAIASTPYHYFESTVQSVGSVTYHWWFQVTNTHTGQVVGYGQWDPYIVIS